MPIITITIPDSITFTSRGVEHVMHTGSYPADIIANLVIHGATQKGADSVADPKFADPDAAKIRVAEVDQNLIDGNWRKARGAAEGMSELDSELFAMARRAVVTAIMAKLGLKRAKELTDDHNKRADELAKTHMEAKRAEWTPIAEATIAARRAAKAGVKAEAAGIDLGDIA